MTTINYAETKELSPSRIRSRLQEAAEEIDLAQQTIKQLNPRKYSSLEDYDNKVTRLNAHIAEFREQREFYQELLRANGEYQE